MTFMEKIFYSWHIEKNIPSVSDGRTDGWKDGYPLIIEIKSKQRQNREYAMLKNKGLTIFMVELECRKTKDG